MRYPMVFVVGMGRSGTHLLAEVVGTCRQYKVYLEEHASFQAALDIALWHRRNRIPELEEMYEKRYAEVGPFVDKTHTVLWCARELNESLPGACFIGIYRNPFAAISSAWLHEPIRKRDSQVRIFPVPNVFLGITKNNMADYYNRMSFEERQALRWLTHYRAMLRLRALPNYLQVRYEDLLLRFKDMSKRIGDFLGVQIPDSFRLRKQSLEKYRQQLSPEKIELIQKVVGPIPLDATGYAQKYP